MNDKSMNNLDKVEDKNPQSNNSRFDVSYFPQSDALTNSINRMFPEQEHEDKKFKEAKKILGDKYTTEDIKSLIASFEYLIRSWSTEYEKKIFDNKTLRELLTNL